MTRPILLATDGSPYAAEATAEAIELARALRAPLLVVTVAQTPGPVYGYYSYADVLPELRKIEHDHVQQVLAETGEAAAAAGLECETIALEGIVASEICRIAERRGARLIVVGAHGWGPIGRLVHGSVSAGVLHEARCPVLIVHRGVKAPLTERDDVLAGVF